jgi:hypothetical protein
MICRVCYYRIHDGQETAWMNRGPGFAPSWVPVHASHAAEGRIFLRTRTWNVVDERKVLIAE